MWYKNGGNYLSASIFVKRHRKFWILPPSRFLNCFGWYDTAFEIKLICDMSNPKQQLCKKSLKLKYKIDTYFQCIPQTLWHRVVPQYQKNFSDYESIHLNSFQFYMKNLFWLFLYRKAKHLVLPMMTKRNFRNHNVRFSQNEKHSNF